jgi:hypothetical protein
MSDSFFDLILANDFNLEYVSGPLEFKMRRMSILLGLAIIISYLILTCCLAETSPIGEGSTYVGLRCREERKLKILGRRIGRNLKNPYHHLLAWSRAIHIDDNFVHILDKIPKREQRENASIEIRAEFNPIPVSIGISIPIVDEIIVTTRYTKICHSN